jgi:TPR repeat protein
MNVIRFRPTVRGRRFGRILALAIVALLLGHAAPVAASTFEDGLAAYHRGDYAEALQLWRSLAEQGNSAAQTALGRIYDEGVGVPQDYVEAARFYRMAAERGHSFGQNNLGVMYMKGEGVPQDYIQAMKWTRKAVAQGNELARWNLDLLLADNAGLQQASPEVMKSYRNAAEKGDADAQYAIGIIYMEGWGVSQDYIQAHMWLNLAAKSGFYVYAKKRDEVAAKMTPAQIAEAQRLAGHWK